MKAPAMHQATQLIQKCYSVDGPDGKRHLVIAADIGRGNEVQFLDTVEGDDGTSVVLGSLIIKSFTFRELSRNNNIETVGVLWSGVAEDLRDVVPALQQAGIQKIDLTKVVTAPVEEASQTLRVDAERNMRTPLRVFRP